MIFYLALKLRTLSYQTLFMKHILFSLRQKADLILQKTTATRDRPLGFQIAVVAIFTIDLIAFISFCVIKMFYG